ncbi:hypothetical protein GF342_02145 [Candidatus Woesearchaeota archaeon]|nr:hypothetical protein [Candidatus Woesearchaeota archaeon]
MSSAAVQISFEHDGGNKKAHQRRDVWYRVDFQSSDRHEVVRFALDAGWHYRTLATSVKGQPHSKVGKTDVLGFARIMQDVESPELYSFYVPIEDQREQTRRCARPSRGDREFYDAIGGWNPA